MTPSPGAAKGRVCALCGKDMLHGQAPAAMTLLVDWARELGIYLKVPLSRYLDPRCARRVQMKLKETEIWSEAKCMARYIFSLDAGAAEQNAAAGGVVWLEVADHQPAAPGAGKCEGYRVEMCGVDQKTGTKIVTFSFTCPCDLPGHDTKLEAGIDAALAARERG